MKDPTAQTGPLTEGQKIVADYEANNIGEPCELAEEIDLAIAEAEKRGEDIILCEWEDWHWKTFGHTVTERALKEKPK